MDVRDFQGKRVVVMGLGKFGGGLDCAQFACNAGADVLVTDMAKAEDLQASLDELAGLKIEYRLGEHVESDFTTADYVIVNPAVPPKNKFLTMAEESGAVVTSQMEIFFQLCSATIIGITGANGKSTTTALTAHLLEAGVGQDSTSYDQVWLGGNIGHKPLLAEIDKITPETLVVLELSSFQLELLARIEMAPKVSIITNLTPNHLDRHGTFEEYCKAKEGIFAFQQLDELNPAVSLFNAEDEVSWQWYEKYQHDEGRACVLYGPDDVEEDYLTGFKCPGRVNRMNLAAAFFVARYFGVPDDCIRKAIPTFEPLPNRLQLVATINGVRWYDDSISTTPDSTIAAIKSFDEHKILIAGGYDKGIPFDAMGREIAEHVKAAVLIGKTKLDIARAIINGGGKTMLICLVDTMEQAVIKCAELADDGDVVLMSPACASYDMFKNYRHRSQVFVECVKALGKKQ